MNVYDFDGTIYFKANDYQQLIFNDPMWSLTDREKRMLEKSWAKYFYLYGWITPWSHWNYAASGSSFVTGLNGIC